MLKCGRHAFDLKRPLVMGIVNVTPDSFHPESRRPDRAGALAQARQMMADGADIVDVGGESTRPGASPVDADDEIARVVPLVEELAASGVAVSVDTMKPDVMRAVLAAGASMINDVRALEAHGALEVLATSDAAVCLMHMQGEPRSMQSAPRYADVVAEVRTYLAARATACEAAGIARERIVIDPGFGFGKTLAHNLALAHALPEFARLGYPVLTGLSRKSSLGAITGRDVADRLPASLAAMLATVARGASIVRVHDVRATVDALKVWGAIDSGVPGAPAG
jgi:dihydropteroate synthase